jgi:uncharacterized domain HDIG
MKNQRAKQIIRWVLTALATTALIILCFPREKSFTYDFALGKPWRHAQLTAAWDFAVEKTDDVFKRERDEAAARVQPYYTLDPSVVTVVTDSFDSANRSRLQTGDISTALRDKKIYYAVLGKLEEVYRDGIIATDDLESLQRDSVSRIKVIIANRASERDVSTLRSVRQAYDAVMQADSSTYGITLLRASNINAYIRPNLTYEQEKTNLARADAMDAVPRNKGLVQAGQKIIGNGDIVDEDAYQTLLSYRKAWNRHNDSAGSELTLFGQILIVTLLILALIVYLARYRKDYVRRPNCYLFLATQVALFPVVAALLVNTVDVMVIPFVMAPLIIRVFLDSRTAFVTHLVIVLITSLIVPEPYLFVLLQLMAGLAAIFSLSELTERSQLFRSTFIVLLAYCVVFFGYELIALSSLSEINRTMYIRFLVNALLLLFTYPLMYMYEKVFRFTSNVTLVELSNINGKLLRTLSEEAPGTFNHSMQVANLAAAASNSIGANSQLVRTGALYHDIGKLENPAFFTENQAGNNPHDNLPFDQSAQIIIDHVNHGLKLAEKYHLPEAIRQFIRTHHGRSKAKYFYISYCNAHPGEVVDESLFTYPGPNPDTAETALLMMADAVEASSRSLKEYTEESIAALVDRIIDAQTAEGCFRDCPLTYRDIQTVKAVFKEKLRTIYHTRISYPELKKE